MPSNHAVSGSAKLIIIGGGIAGYSLAYEAAKLEIESIVLDNGQPGTTHAATGILDARADHLLRDVESVEQTAREVVEWQNCFPHPPYMIKPKHFLLPIGPLTPHGRLSFDILFGLYEKVAHLRSGQLPNKHRILPPSLIEQMEPNLKKNYFKSAISFWLWTADPDAMLMKVRNEAVMFSSFARILPINKIIGFKTNNSYIQEVIVEDRWGKHIKIKNSGPLVVVNATGPWIGETLKDLNIKFPIELKLGIQAKFPGYYFQSDSGLITFGRDGKYVICLQEKGYLQVGPTNSSFRGRLPVKLGTASHDLGYLEETLADILEEGCPVSTLELLKYGWRVKPKYIIDTDRPIIWHHNKDGITNLYTAVPGKMVLGLLMARGLLSKLVSDGWIQGSTHIYSGKTLSLDGKKPFHNQIKLAWLYIKVHLVLATYFIKKALHM